MLLLMGGVGIMSFASSLTFLTLPVILTKSIGEVGAGAYMTFFMILQIFLFIPLSGSISDMIGSRAVLRFSALSFFVAGCMWFLFGSNLWGALTLGFFLYIGFSFRKYETYLLRTTPKKEGGLVFGFASSMRSVALFLSASMMVFFLDFQHHKISALLLMGSAIFFLFILYFLQDDMPRKKKIHIQCKEMCNILVTIQHAFHFIRMNGYMPLFVLGSRVFSGFFFGSLWFLLPLEVAQSGQEGIQTGLQLSIYEISTMFLGGLAGLLSDKYNWKYSNIIGWVCVGVAAFFLPFFAYPSMLIALGFLIGVGYNFASNSANHALEEYDIDHREDGSFLSFCVIVENIGWAFAPLITSVLYTYYTFSVSLLVPAAAGVLSAISVLFLMSWISRKKKKEIV